MTTGIVLLAAGASTRMGQSKQLLPIGGIPLLHHATLQALGASSHLMVVLGSNASAHESILKPMHVPTIINTNWETGMGSSIKTGVRELLSLSPHLDNIVLMVCDQPSVTSSYLNLLISSFHTTHATIVSSRYQGTLGVPAIFSNIHFHDLLGLEDNSGAKSIILKYAEEVVALDFPGGAEDLDTPEDYDRFIKSRK